MFHAKLGAAPAIFVARFNELNGLCERLFYYLAAGNGYLDGNVLLCFQHTQQLCLIFGLCFGHALKSAEFLALRRVWGRERVPGTVFPGCQVIPKKPGAYECG